MRVYLDKKFPFLWRGSPIEIIEAQETIEPEEKRAVVKGLDDWWWDLTGAKSDSGITVTETTALNFSAVWSAVKLLGESVAGLPLQVFKSDGQGKELMKLHPIYPIVHDNPNPLQTRFTFLQTLMTSVLLYGNAFARIVKDKFARPVQLIFLHPEDVTVILKDGQLFYEVFLANGTKDVFAARDMIHILGLSTDGIIGKSVVSNAKESIGLGLGAEKFGNLFFGNGSNSELAYTSPSTLDDEQYKRLQELLTSRNAGLGKAHKPLLLEGGMEAKQLTIPPDQAQFLQTRKFQVNEIARWFNVPPHMIGDLERSTNNNIEQQSIEFVQFSVVPWLNRIEQEFTKKLFLEEEKPAFFVEFNVEGLLRGDVKTRAELYRVLWNISGISANEIRSKENMNPYDGGDKKYKPVNMEDVNNPISDTSED